MIGAFFVAGFLFGVPAGYQLRRLYSRKMWQLSRSLRDRAKGIDRDSY